MLFHFGGRCCLFPFNDVLFTQQIPNDMILLCMDYDVTLRLGKNEGWNK